jgi:hypothetical protein
MPEYIGFSMHEERDARLDVVHVVSDGCGMHDLWTGA